MRVLACVALLLVAGAHADGGLGFSISRTALDKTTDAVLNFVNNYFQDLYLPNFNISVPVKPLGDVDAQFTNITLQNLNVGQADFEVPPPASFGLTLGPLSFDLSLDFHFDVASVPTASGSGSLTASPKDGIIKAELAFTVTSGVLSVAAGPDTSANVGNLDVVFNGPDGYIYNLIWGEVAPQVTAQINTAIVNEFKKLDASIDSLLQKIPTSVDLNLGADFDVALDIGFTRVESTGVLFDIVNNLAFSDAADKTACPLPRSPLPPHAAVDPSAEFQLFLSDTVISCPLWVLYKNNVIAATITPTSEPSLAKYLNTSVFQDLLPPLYNKYPNDAIDVGVTLAAPVVLNTSSADGFIVSTTVAANMSAVTPSGAMHMCTLGVPLTIAIDVAIVDEGTPKVPTVTLKATELDLALTVIDSSVGTLDVSGLNSLLKLAGPLLLPTINKKLDTLGLPLGPILGLSFVDPQVGYNAGYFSLSGNVSYAPPLATPLTLPQL